MTVRLRSTTLLVLSVLLSAWVSGCAGAPKKPTPQEIEKMAKPATVCIFSVYKARISVPKAEIPPDRIKLLKRRLIAKVRAGEVSAHDRKGLVRAAVAEILDHIFTYMVPSHSMRTFRRGIVEQGSGFFITPDGYLVTNAHVVSEDEDGLKVHFVKSVLHQLIAQDVKDFQRSLGSSVTPHMVHELEHAAPKWYVHYMQIGKLHKQILAEPGIAVGAQNAQANGMPASIVKMGTPMPGKDVAILKVEGNHMVTLPLRYDTETLQVGDQIYTLGYPGLATFAPYLKATRPIEPTWTRGVISARKSMAGGWNALQTDASITHGNSGGPAMDDHGRVIGLTTWGTVDVKESAGGQVQANQIAGENFLVPASVVKEFIQQAGVTPTQGLVTKLLRQAVQKMAIAHYKVAVHLLDEVKAVAPNTPWISSYISDAQSQILAGQDKSWQEDIPTVAGVTIAVLILGVLAAVRWGRRPGRPSATSHGTIGYAQPGQAPPPHALPPQAQPPQIPPPQGSPPEA